MKLPTNDIHFQKAAADGFYHQRKHLMMGLSEVRQWRTAIDVGAHIGFMSVDLAKFFKRVVAFEPQPENFECLQANVPDNVECFDVALGKDIRKAGMYNPRFSNSGAWELIAGDAVCVYPLDSFGIEDVDFIKIDVQGYEMDVLQGAVTTLSRYQPTVLIECPKGTDWEKGSDTMQFLMELGARPIMKRNNDVVLRW